MPRNELNPAVVIEGRSDARKRKAFTLGAMDSDVDGAVSR
jgi:hypothetical protein